MVNTTPWQPSGAPATIVTTLAIVPGDAVAPAGTTMLKPDAFDTDTLAAGQFVGSLDVIDPAVIDVNVTGYGFVFAELKNRSPCVNPGYRSAAPEDADTVTFCAVKALAPELPVPLDAHRAYAPALASVTETASVTASLYLLNLIEAISFRLSFLPSACRGATCVAPCELRPDLTET